MPFKKTIKQGSFCWWLHFLSICAHLQTIYCCSTNC